MNRVRHHQVGPRILCFTCMQRKLLEEEGVAVRFGDDFFCHQVDEALGAEHRPNHLQAVVAR